jgi:hypothetical protein
MLHQARQIVEVHQPDHSSESVPPGLPAAAAKSPQKGTKFQNMRTTVKANLSKQISRTVKTLCCSSKVCT